MAFAGRMGRPKVKRIMLVNDHVVVRKGLRALIEGIVRWQACAQALDALSRHQPYFSPSVSETLLQGYLHAEPTRDPKQLTPRERQVAKMVAGGKSNEVMASVLSLSTKTIETHRSAAMHKVGARSAADLTLYAARDDLVQV